MVELGLVKAIQAGLVTAGVTVPGGYFATQLPKDLPNQASPKAWAYRFVVQRPEKTLSGQSSYTEALVQIDCHGWDGDGGGAARAVDLAKSIELVMRGLGPTILTDPDQIRLQTVYLDDVNDGFNDASRSYVRSLDYSIQFHRK